MSWTKELPREPGWYWWRESVAYGGKVVWLSSQAFVLECNGRRDFAATMGGEWYGPLVPPGGDAIEDCSTQEDRR